MAMKNIRFVVFSAIVLWAHAAFAAQEDLKLHEIRQPTFGQPAVVLIGGTFDITIEAASAGQVESASVTPSLTEGAKTGVPLQADLQKGDNALTAALPAGVPPGMYDFCVHIVYKDTAADDCQPHAVAVFASMEPPFTFAQLTDFHVGDPRAERQIPGVDIKKVRMAALAAVNSANPAFVLITGDVNAYPETYDADYPESMTELRDNLKVPALIIPGNHDLYAHSDMDGNIIVEGMNYWDDYFGIYHRALDFGPYRFVLFNTYGWPVATRNKNREFHNKVGTTHTYQGTLSKDEYDWIVQNLKSAGGRVPILVSHHGPRQFEVMPQQWCADCIPMAKMMSLIKKSKAPYYIFGHIHRNEDTVDSGTEFIATTSTGSDVSKDELWAIRLFHVKPDLTIETEIVTLFDTPPMK